MPDATHHVFLSWLRRGLGAALSPSSVTRRGERLELRVAVDIERRLDRGEPETRTEMVALPMFGPDDVTGLDAGAVLRTWPRPDVTDAEQTGLVLVEFSEPDLPWRYTPEVESNGNLRPWISLVVLAEDEFRLHPSGADRLITEVELLSAEVPLPSANEAWAWAHVDVDIDTATVPSNETLASFLLREPQGAVSRLVASRRLAARKRYTAMVVPTSSLASGSQPTGTQPTGTQPMGTQTAGTASPTRRMKVYHHWSFSTGAEGDFVTLVRRIRSATQLPSEVGSRSVSLSSISPSYRPALPPSAPQSLQLQGALVPLSAEKEVPIGLQPTGSGISSFASLLNEGTRNPRAAASAPGHVPLVAPPAYGSFFFPNRPLPDTIDGSSAPWYWGLNLDVHRRIAAGIATQVVQTHQQALMASAWAQVDGIRAIQETLNFTRLSRDASRRIYRRDLEGMRPEALLLFTEPVHAQVRHGQTTVAAKLGTSLIPAGVLDPTWRRFARPRGALGRRQRRAGQSPRPLLERLNDGTLRAARPPARPPVTTCLDLLFKDDRDRKELEAQLGRCSLASQIVLSLFPSAGEAARSPEGLTEMVLGGTAASPATTNAVVDLIQELGHVGRPVREPAPVDLNGLAATILAALDPAVTLGASIRDRLQLDSSRVQQESDDPLSPVLSYPEFTQPMSEALQDLSQEWILPGLDKVPNNRAALLKANRAFIAAYLMGLNHEMARELLWQGYPTDQRGSYFQRFWRHLPDDKGETPPDVPPVHRWTRSTSLSKILGSEENVVFLVRADLLQRYPTTVLAAVQLAGSSETLLPPSFVGTMKPDVMYAGFDRSRDEFREEGWYFAIQEQVSETRFRDPSPPPAGQPPSPVFVPVVAGESAAALAQRLLHAPTRVLVPASWYLDEQPEVAS